MPNVLSPSDPVSLLIASRLRELRLGVNAFADTVFDGHRMMAKRVLSGWLKLPFFIVGKVAAFLELDPAGLRNLMVETYLGQELKQPLARLGESLGASITLPMIGDKNEIIAADEELMLPKLRIRQLLARHPDGFSLEEAAATLLVDVPEALEVVSCLEEHSMVSRIDGPPPGAPRWRLERDGAELAGRSAPKPLERESAFSLLVSFLECVSDINARDNLFLYVADVTVLGETLIPGVIPHVEVAVTLSARHADPGRRNQALTESMMRGWDWCLTGAADFGDCGFDWPVQELKATMAEAGLPIAIRWRFDAQGSSLIH